MKLRVILAIASAMLLTGVFVLGVEAGPVCPGDADSDGICDDKDNCLGVNNPIQYDADWDGYGNICDNDINNNCIVGVGDIGAVIAAFGNPAPDAADVNELNGLVDVSDIGQVIGDFGAVSMGPSGKPCQTCPSPVGTAAGACPGGFP
jgi:hypothetical protein